MLVDQTDHKCQKILTAIAFFTSTLHIAKIKMAAAGIRGISPIRNSLENSSPAPAAALPEADCSHPITRYATQDITKGNDRIFHQFRYIFHTYPYGSLLPQAECWWIQANTGPRKRRPDIAAPPARARLISIAWAMAIQMGSHSGCPFQRKFRSEKIPGYLTKR